MPSKIGETIETTTGDARQRATLSANNESTPLLSGIKTQSSRSHSHDTNGQHGSTPDTGLARQSPFTSALVAEIAYCTVSAGDYRSLSMPPRTAL